MQPTTRYDDSVRFASVRYAVHHDGVTLAVGRIEGARAYAVARKARGEFVWSVVRGPFDRSADAVAVWELLAAALDS